ncbi:HPr family phosphocarrier protein [Yersinia sp. LJYL362]|uniref:HPr family phosphocarrier protein n=1 Tax=Yersinia sp. LJYL362 TaxID=3402108 RepID=UPI003AB2621A
MLKFAANLSMMFTEVPFLERFKAAKNAGFSGVEFLFPYDYPADQLAAQLKDQGLQQVLFNTSPGDIHAGEWGLAALPGREKEARRDIDLALEYALALDCPSIHIMAGVVPVGAGRQDYQQVFIDNVRYAADRFAEHNINAMIEALNPKIKPHYLFSSQYQTLELLNIIDRPNVFTQLDLFHAQIVDGNLSHLITSFAGRYGHIQIASVPERHEPDEGEINYAYLFGLLDEINYKGWIGCEYHPRASTVAGLNWIQPYLS